jgi:hypothetical protein
MCSSPAVRFGFCGHSARDAPKNREGKGLINTPRLSNASHNGRELSRLMNAAAISKEFCELLLADPAAALTTGCNGELFCLTPEEEKLILSIRAASLPDFAIQLTQRKPHE